MKSHHGNRHGFNGTRNFKFSDPLQILHSPYSRCRYRGSQIKADNKHLFLFAKLLANKRMKQSKSQRQGPNALLHISMIPASSPSLVIPKPVDQIERCENNSK